MVPSSAKAQPTNPVWAAVRRFRLTLLGVGLISGVINVLALTGSVYMLQVYDRVLPARSVETLLALTVLMIGLFAAFGLLDFVRTRVMMRLGLQLDQRLRTLTFKALIRSPPGSSGTAEAQSPVRDLDTVRSFFGSPAPTALFDLPWIPLYMLLIFLLHPWLGVMALTGAALLFGLALVTELVSRTPSRRASASSAQRAAVAEQSRRNAEVILALGMEQALADRWRETNAVYMRDQVAALAAGSGLGAVSRFLRMLLQSAILGLGAYLVIRDQASAGVMIASSIALGRALSPIEIAISNWRMFVAARQSLERLTGRLAAVAEPHVMALPRPSAALTVEGLAVAPPGSSRPIIQGISFGLTAGDGLAVIGPSASGKSTLARALVGAWAPLPERGTVRLDRATIDQWSSDDLGALIGYLPQEIGLFDGTIAENVSRFQASASSAEVIRAAELAGVHDMIVAFPEGYNTRIGESGTALSAGQRQRIALARALFRDPFLVVLDEPNSNLDSPGEAALQHAIRAVRARRGIVVVIAHRPAALAGLDKVLVMNGGLMQAFGQKDEVLRRLAQAAETEGTQVAGRAGPGKPGPKIVTVARTSGSGTGS